MGYHRAGFDVVGIDVRFQPRYPFPFLQGDAFYYLEKLLAGLPIRVPEPFWLNDFAAIHASPPCQVFAETAMSRKRKDLVDLLSPTRELLRETGSPYVIENIATAPMPDSIILCGATFGLPIIRHRRFEIQPSIGLVPSLCKQQRYGRAVDHGSFYAAYAHGSWCQRWRDEVVPAVWPWMSVEEAGQAVPPAYTQFIGEQLMEHSRRGA